MERRLPGDDHDDVLEEDAEHWVAVYSELTGFARRLVVVGSAPAGLAEQLGGMEERLLFWEERIRGTHEVVSTTPGFESKRKE